MSPRNGAAATDLRAVQGAERDQVLQLLPDARAERVVAVGRLLLSACALLAVTIEDAQSEQLVWVTVALLAYSVYGATLLVLLRVAHARVLRHRLTIHLVDLGVLGALLLITGASTSGFFSALLIPVLAATLRWQDRGALATGAAVLLFFITVEFYDYLTADLDIDVAFVRSAVLAAVILLLAEIGRLERRHRAQVSHVARAPRTRSGGLDEIIEELLPHAAAAIGAPRAMLVVEQEEEPWLRLYEWSSGQHNRSHVPHVSDEPLVMPDLVASPFLWTPGSAVVYLSGESLQLYRREPIAAWFAPHVKADSALVAPVGGQGVRGQLFLLDAQDVTGDDLRVALVVARHVSNALEHFALTQQLRAMSTAQERARISRELHDGVLQTLTGIALKLATVSKLVKTSPAEAGEQLRELEQLILEEQRDLRFYTLELRLRAGIENDGLLFGQALGGLVSRVEKVWGIGVKWKREDAERVPPELGWETYQLLHEAMVNATRHGIAKHVVVQIDRSDSTLNIVISDDGIGFPFRGRMEMDTLVAEKRGPRSLRERVQTLGGRMAVDSQSSGATLDIQLPIGEHRL